MDKVVKSYYDWQTMSYPAFLTYLAKNNLSASTKDLVIPDAGHNLHGHHDDHHHPHAHLHRSFLSKILQFQNPASIWKGFEMMWHGIEHTLEK